MKFGYLLAALCLLIAACDRPDVANKKKSPEKAPMKPIQADPAAMERFEAVETKYNDEMATFSDAYRAIPATEKEKRNEVFKELYPKPETFAEEMMAIVDEFPKTEGSAEALAWIANYVRQGDSMGKAVEILVSDDYIASDVLARVSSSLKYARKNQKTIDHLKTMIEKSPHDQIKANSIYSLVGYYEGIQQMQQQLEKNPEVTFYTEEEKEFATTFTFDQQEVDGLYERLINEFGDLKPNSRTKQTFRVKVESARFETENLQVGMVAPDIEGDDLDGKSFKLSDYRGKVVLLDFWGDW